MLKRPGKLDIKEGALYLSAILGTLLLLLYFMYRAGFVYHLPLTYGGDAMAGQVFIKSILDTGWFISNPFLGAPFGYSFADYPMSDSTNFFLMKLFGWVQGDSVSVMHNFLFATYFLAALTSLYVFRRLGLSRLFAFAGSLLFSFLGYHFYRAEGHLLLSAYYAVPIYIFFALAIFQDRPFASSDLKTVWIKGLLSIVILAICASTGVYYAFFGAYFILIAGLIAGIDQKSWKPLLRAGFLVFIISGTVFLNILPSFISTAKYGKNLEASYRHFVGAEIYALKITHLFLPDQYGPLGKLKTKYAAVAPLVNENVTSDLGVFGVLGFIGLLGVVLLRKTRLSDSPLFDLSRLNMAGILLATIGGLGSLFAIFISPKIRAYNRISVFIAFFALAAFFLLVQKFLKKKPKVWQHVTTGVLVLLCVISILFGPVKKWSNVETKVSVDSDRAFVAQIEKQIPQGMVFQLPIMPFPENGGIHKMYDYELFRGYLYSHTLKWSYGAMRGRMPIQWQQWVGLAPEAEMLRQLSYAGFSGIYINRKGYPDRGARLERNLTTLLQQAPLESQDGDLIFYQIADYAKQLRQSLPEKVWNRKVFQVKNIGWIWGKNWGFSKALKGSISRSSLNKKYSVLEIVNRGQVPVKVKLQARFSAKKASGLDLILSGDLFKKTLHVSAQGTPFNQDVIVKPGRHFVYFKAKDGQQFTLTASHFSVDVLEAGSRLDAKDQ